MRKPCFSHRSVGLQQSRSCGLTCVNDECSVALFESDTRLNLTVVKRYVAHRKGGAQHNRRGDARVKGLRQNKSETMRKRAVRRVGCVPEIAAPRLPQRYCTIFAMRNDRGRVEGSPRGVERHIDSNPSNDLRWIREVFHCLPRPATGPMPGGSQTVCAERYCVWRAQHCAFGVQERNGCDGLHDNIVKRSFGAVRGADQFNKDARQIPRTPGAIG